jgi:hypothetical protein
MYLFSRHSAKNFHVYKAGTAFDAEKLVSHTTQLIHHGQCQIRLLLGILLLEGRDGFRPQIQ